MSSRQTTTENGLCEGSEGVDTTQSGVLLLNYRLEHFIMTQCRLHHSDGYLKGFLSSLSLSLYTHTHTRTHIYIYIKGKVHPITGYEDPEGE